MSELFSLCTFTQKERERGEREREREREGGIERERESKIATSQRWLACEEREKLWDFFQKQDRC